MMQAKGKSSFINNTKRVSPLKMGDHCYALLFGNRRNKEPRWVPATIVKKKGARMFHVRIFPNGPVWRRHLDQLRPRYFSSEDHDPGEDSSNTRVPSFSSEDCRTPDPGEPPHATMSGNLLPVNNSGTDVPPASRNDNTNAENALSAPSFESVSDTNNAGIQYSRENPRRSNRNRKFPAHLHDFYGVENFVFSLLQCVLYLMCFHLSGRCYVRLSLNVLLRMIIRMSGFMRKW